MLKAILRTRALPPAAAMLLAALGAACPAAAQAVEPRNPDPWEAANRRVYTFNRGLDRAIVRPVARSYKAVAPRPLRAGVHNALSNLGEPLVVVNDVLQLRPGRAARAAVRFAANSTLGVFGLFDVAGRSPELAHHASDFGMTLARYGVGPGPYVFVPVLGPSTLRDLTGRTVELFADPVSLVRFHGDRTFLYTRIGLIVVDTRANLDPVLRELDRTATDPYATLRAVYLQNRAAEVGGHALDVQALPNFGPEPAEPAPAPQP